jgi:hypothetical protein
MLKVFSYGCGGVDEWLLFLFVYDRVMAIFVCLLAHQFDIFYIISWSLFNHFTLSSHPFIMPIVVFSHTYEVDMFNKLNVVNYYNFPHF